ncbi:hypothetical protein UB46_29450 [Burkholderiaceae bacterium 16]|nr:hypothetical protein UB46_29450 [Burkholderiaceae bacterium 16]
MQTKQISKPARLLWIVVFIVLLPYALVVGKQRSEKVIGWIGDKFGGEGGDETPEDEELEEVALAQAVMEPKAPIAAAPAPVAVKPPRRPRSMREIAAGMAPEPAFTATESIGARCVQVRKIARKRVFFYQYANHVRRVLPDEARQERQPLGMLTRAEFEEAGLPFGIDSAVRLTELALRSDSHTTRNGPKAKLVTVHPLHGMDVNAALADASAPQEVPPGEDAGYGLPLPDASEPVDHPLPMPARPNAATATATVTPIARATKKPIKVGVGRILDMGVRRFTPDGRKPYQCFTITLEKRDGSRKAFSGEHLAELVSERHVRIGDTVKISMLGRVAVQVPHPEQDGKWIDTHRNEFEIRHVRAAAA